MEIRILFLPSIVLIVILILAAPCSHCCIYAVALAAVFVLTIMRSPFPPLPGCYSCHCSFQSSWDQVCKANKKSPEGRALPPDREVSPHPSKRGGAETNAGIIKPDDIEGKGKEAVSRERKWRWYYLVVDEQGQWWLLA